MIAYKVVYRRNDNRRVSVVSGKRQTEYHIGKETKRKISKNGKLFGPLACFKDFASAWCFCPSSDFQSFEIWEAEVKINRKTYFVWTNKSDYMNVGFLPTGTILCDSVKLLKKVYPNTRGEKNV